MSPGRSLRHSTGCGLPDTEFSKLGALKIPSFGPSPPVALATAHCTARRALSLPVATVNSLKSGLSLLLSVQKHPRMFPSEVASAGTDRPDFLNSGSAPTKDGPKSETMTSILGFFAISAVRTCCVRAGSQFVTSKGAELMNLYSGPRTDLRPSSSSLPWLLPAGPLMKRRLPPLGRMLLIQLPQFAPSFLNDAPMNFV